MLVGLGVHQLSHQILYVVAVANEVLCQLTQQSGMRRLQRPGRGRRIVLIETHRVEEIRRIDYADSKEFLPQVVDRRTRKLEIGSDFPSQSHAIVLTRGWAASAEEIDGGHVCSTAKGRWLARRTVTSGRVEPVVLEAQ